MTEENVQNQSEQEEQLETQEQPASERFKDDPTYKAMAQQLADLRRKEQERMEAEEKARKDAEIKELESRGQYEAAIKAREDELESLKNQHAAELQQRDLTAELLKAGFSNEMFMRGAVANYNQESGSILEYVQGLVGDESNAAFLSKSAPAREPLDPPPSVGSVGKKPNWDQVKVWEQSENREERIKARGILAEYRKEHGKYPY